MAFRADHSKAQQNDSLKPEGEYECIIQKIEEKTTPKGKRKLSVWLEIRNDVEQGYKNGLIFHDIWAKKEPSMDDAAVNGYNYAQLMAIAAAVKLPQEKEYEDLNALIADMVDKPMLVYLYHDDYNDKYYEKVRWVAATKYPEVKHVGRGLAPAVKGAQAVQFAAPSAAAGGASSAATESDDDYPF